MGSDTVRHNCDVSPDHRRYLLAGAKPGVLVGVAFLEIIAFTRSVKRFVTQCNSDESSQPRHLYALYLLAGISVWRRR